ncbi:MAG: thymidine kinase [Gammaproteobacteria bacterium]|nr:thymidine kinase [Gammaproteobacteria bacterium]
MAKLYFYYSAMNAGKSSTLLQSAYNYKERGMDTLMFVAALDDRYETGKITSRIGLQANAVIFDGHFDFFEYTANALKENPNIACIFVDDAHFLCKHHVEQLSRITVFLKRPVLAYGLRSDFRGELFPATQYLLAWAEELVEIKTICHCGRKATMNMRIDEQGRPVKSGEQIEVGGNERYISVCREHFLLGDSGGGFRFAEIEDKDREGNQKT